MTTKFKCCKKDFNNYCCMVCYNVYHASCMDRLKNIETLYEHRIICSGKCKDKYDAEIKEKNRLIMEVRNSKQELEEKNILMDKIEIDNLDAIEELQRNNDALINEIKERDLYIQRLERRIKDFEDEVLEVDQKYETKFTEQRKTVANLNKDIIAISNANKLLQEEVSEKNLDLEKISDEIQELKEINGRMLTSIETLEAENQMYCDEMYKLRHKMSDNAMLTFPHPNRNKPTNLVETRKSEKKKIVLISNYQGRYLSEYLSNQVGNNFCVESIVKPNANNQELVETALNNAKYLNKNDTIILWPNTCSRKLVNDFLMQLKKLRALIITQPYYRFNYKGVNEAIYANNLELFKAAYETNLGDCVLDCNNFLKKK